MQAAGDARTLERLPRRVFLTDRHQTGHLGLGDGNLAAAPIGQPDIGDHVVGNGVHHDSSRSCCIGRYGADDGPDLLARAAG